MITTNVWVRQVRHLNLSSSVKLSKKVNISSICFEFKTRLAQQRFSQGPSVFTKQTALLCSKFESILLLKRALWMTGLGFRDLQWVLGHFSWLSNCQGSVSPDLHSRDERFREIPITTSFFVAIVVNEVQLQKKLTVSVEKCNTKICLNEFAAKRALQNRNSVHSSSERSFEA